MRKLEIGNFAFRWPLYNSSSCDRFREIGSQVGPYCYEVAEYEKQDDRGVNYLAAEFARCSSIG